LKAPVLTAAAIASTIWLTTARLSAISRLKRRSSALRDQEEHDRLVNEEFEELSTSDQFIEGVPA